MIFDIRFSFVPCHVLLRFRLRARVRSLFFDGFAALIFQMWKPSIPEALGGRRGSRSDKNYQEFLKILRNP